MDWLILIVVVPVVLVPIVLLCGFVGCGELLLATGPSSEPAVDPTPSSPFDLVTKVVNVGVLRLEWKHASPATVSFTLARREPGAGYTNDHKTMIPGTSIEDTLPAAGVYAYMVRAVAGGVVSNWSNQVTASRPDWRGVYTGQGAPNVPAAAFDGRCVVQRMDPAVLAAGGHKVRITVFNGSTTPLNIQRIYVSAPAVVGTTGNPTPDAWDSGVPLVKVLEGGTIIDPNASPSFESDLFPEPFTFDNSQPLLVSFDINSGFVTRWRTGVGMSTSYERNNLTEAASANRSPNYQDRPDTVLLISKIEALN